MIYEEVTFEKNFQVGEFLFEKAIIKGKLEPGETIAQALNAAKVEAIDWFNKSNPHLALGSRAVDLTGLPMDLISKGFIQAEKPIPEEDRINQLIEDINNCPTLEELLTFRTILNTKASKSFPKLQEAYDTMYQKLSQ